MSETASNGTLRLGALRQRLATLPRTLALVQQAAKSLTWLWAGLLLAQGLLPALLALCTRALVDGIVAATQTDGDWTRLRVLAVPIGWMIGLTLLSEALGGSLAWVRALQAERVQDHIKGLIHRQAATIDYALYEQPEFYDHLHIVRYEADSRPLALLETLGNIAQNGVTLCALGALLLPYGWWIPFALALSASPALGVATRHALRRYRWNARAAAEMRRASYNEWLLTAREPAAELRLYALGRKFQSAYQEIRRKLRQEKLNLIRSEGQAVFVTGLFALIVTLGTMAALLDMALHKRISLGGLALFYQVFVQSQRLMRTLLESVGAIYSHSLFLERLFAFLDTQPARPVSGEDEAQAQPAELRLQQVTFRYPGSATPALHGVDLTIPAGQTIALVGANGAGKSALLKLLCRLYEPEQGTIVFGGRDIRETPLEAWYRRLAVVFQEPMRYSATAAENIALGSADAEMDRARIETAARAAGAHEFIERLPQGYDTMLGKGFAQGVELSGGQWQRIALARALLRDAPILLLDEPTSALDAWAEAEWLPRFRSLATGRTVVIVTHRFTTAMHADRIYVMEQGRILESGSHCELLAQAGRYARSWQAQQSSGATETQGSVASESKAETDGAE